MATGASSNTSRVSGSLNDPRVPGGSRAIVISELALTASGIFLSLFMLGHSSLLLTVVIAADTFDELAKFLEDYYLLQLAIAPTIFVLMFHMVLAGRRIPSTFANQAMIMRHLRSIRHVDTWTWALQVVTGIALIVMASLHLWIILTDLPIEAGKSAARVIEGHLWFDIPFLLIVQSHIAFGLFRIGVKWGVMSRSKLRLVLGLWTTMIIAVGATVITTFYQLGGEV